MAQRKNSTDLTELLLKCMAKPDPMLSMPERLHREIRRRTSVVGIFPNPDSYLRLVTTYLMEYADDWSASRAYLNPTSVQALLQNAA